MTSNNSWEFQDRQTAIRLLRTAGALIELADQYPDVTHHAWHGIGILRRLPNIVEDPSSVTFPPRADELVRLGLARVPMIVNPETAHDWAAKAVRDALMAAAVLGGHDVRPGSSEQDRFVVVAGMLDRAVRYAIENDLLPEVSEHDWVVFTTLLGDGFAPVAAAHAAALV